MRVNLWVLTCFVLPCLSLISAGALAAQMADVSVTVSPLRDGPGGGFDTLKKLPKGSRLQVSNYPKQGFYKARAFDGVVGWVDAHQVTITGALAVAAVPAPAGAVVTRVRLRAMPGASTLIATRRGDIKAAREASQPVRARTGGSTFRNPDGMKAWELIDAAGCRGLVRGGAMVSEKHCNFLINTGSATAADIEGLGEEVRRRVLAATGVTLHWEIRRIGIPSGRPEVVA